MDRRITLSCLAIALATPAVSAQSNVSAVNKFSWGENTGFMNWRDANGMSQGVVVHGKFLAGYIWAENAGWIFLGNGSPTLCNCYYTAVSAGVNIGTQDVLTGFGWGENIGWVNFQTADPGRPAAQWARYDRAARRLRGYAWGENVGWICLDDAAVFVSTTLCPADADANGLIEPADVAFFVNSWFCSLLNGIDAGDFDNNGAVQPADVSLFVSTWFTAATAGC